MNWFIFPSLILVSGINLLFFKKDAKVCDYTSESDSTYSASFSEFSFASGNWEAWECNHGD